ncbi:MAG: hypothetical protein COW39_08130 [Comamonadaceae bacterium CG17_big_fil_post_rev_8_21_14_2_50_60_13]|nr:MAG: hypothetical protein COW39_08130 [Comamonadaceae bacterium CG17_big_fil_post_rev_8_21_14_2_50_60_13]
MNCIAIAIHIKDGGFPWPVHIGGNVNNEHLAKVCEQPLTSHQIHEIGSPGSWHSWLSASAALKPVAATPRNHHNSTQPLSFQLMLLSAKSRSSKSTICQADQQIAIRQWAFARHRFGQRSRMCWQLLAKFQVLQLSRLTF